MGPLPHPKHNKTQFQLGFFQDGSIGNLSSLSQASQKTLLNLSKGNPNLPIINLQQLYGIITNEPLTPDIFIHLTHQLLMEITPGHLVDDMNLVCPRYTKKIMYISKNTHTHTYTHSNTY